jgi:hypothetical protein
MATSFVSSMISAATCKRTTVAERMTLASGVTRDLFASTVREPDLQIAVLLTYIELQCMKYLRMELGKDLVAACATPLVLAILAEGDSYRYRSDKLTHRLLR